MRNYRQTILGLLPALALAVCTGTSASGQTLKMLRDGGGSYVREGTATVSCGGTELTQSTNDSTISQGTVRCGSGTPAVPVDNFYCRSFAIASDTQINCIDYGVRSNTGAAPTPSNPWPLRIRLYIDSNGGVPDTAHLVLVPGSERWVTIPVMNSPGSFFTVNYVQPIIIPGGSQLVVEQFQPSRQLTTTIAGDNSSGLSMGTNTLGESAPTYIKAPACGGLGDYATMASIGFTTIHAVINLGTTPGNTCSLPLKTCSSDIFPAGGNGTVDIDDLLAVIGSWGQTGPPRPVGDVFPGPSGTGNCTVNIDDLLQTIGQWGTCPPASGACCLPNGTCSTMTTTACAAANGSFKGDKALCAWFTCPVVPANNLCANAATAVNGNNSFDNTNANNNGPATATCVDPTQGMGHDMWFDYTASCTGHVVFDTLLSTPDLTDTVITIYNGTGCSPLGAEIGCNDDSATNNGLSSAQVDLTSGQHVRVRVSSAGNFPEAFGNRGPGVLRIACTLADNDNCVDATPLTMPSNNSASNMNTAQQDVVPDCPSTSSKFGRWFKVTGNGHNLRARTCDSPIESWDMGVSVYCVDPIHVCGVLTCVAGSQTLDCDSGNNPGAGSGEIVNWCSANGQVYYVLVYAAGAAPTSPEGSYNLKVTDLGTTCTTGLVCGAPPPANDECAGAVTVVSGNNNINTTNATNSTPNNTTNGCAVFCNNDAWYKYTATATASYAFSLCNTSVTALDTVMIMFTGTCGAPVEVGCNDDFCGGGSFSQVTLNITSGTQYLIRIGGWSASASAPGATGPMILNIGPAVPAPPNDECTGATVITTLPFTQTVDVSQYSHNASDPVTTCETAGGGPFTKVGGWWYKFTPGTTGLVTVKTCLSAGVEDTVIGVFTGSCGSFTEVACNDDSCEVSGFGRSTLQYTATAGVNYFILVDCYSGGGSGTGGVFGPVRVDVTSP